MHRIRHHENEHAPCNYYCDGDIHTDIIFLSGYHVHLAQENLLVYVRDLWQRAGYHRTSTIFAIEPAPETEDSSSYYPRGFRRNPGGDYKAFRVQYRIHGVATMEA
jgi:hypothetical protein